MTKNLKIVTILLSFVLLLFTVKGNTDTFLNQDSIDTYVGGPFESSNSTSRYVLTEAISKRGSVILTKEEAAIASPDVAEKDNKYFSLFMPGLSVLSSPLYALGSIIGKPQLFTYFTNIILALLNMWLIYLISIKLFGNKTVSLIGGICYLFGSNVWAYSLGMTQHNLSTTVILFSILILFFKNKTLSSFLLGAIVGISMLVDIPNIIFTLPILIGWFVKNINFTDYHLVRKTSLKILIFFIGLFPMMILYVKYNLETTGSAVLSAQFLGRSSDFMDESTSKFVDTYKKDSAGQVGMSLPFETRNLVQGIDILLFSDERGLFFYFPIYLLSLVGFYVSVKKNPQLKVFHNVAISVIFIVLITYSMFGDPWGGWSFGPRYLIPAISILSIFLPGYFFINAKNLYIYTLFLILFIPSVYVSSLGALTTSNIPPKQEAEALMTGIPYNIELNRQYIKNESSSLLYNTVINRYLQPTTYHSYVFLFAIVFSFVILSFSAYKHENKK